MISLPVLDILGGRECIVSGGNYVEKNVIIYFSKHNVSTGKFGGTMLLRDLDLRDRAHDSGRWYWHIGILKGIVAWVCYSSGRDIGDHTMTSNCGYQEGKGGKFGEGSERHICSTCE